jgi:hypothetical protein
VRTDSLTEWMCVLALSFLRLYATADTKQRYTQGGGGVWGGGVCVCVCGGGGGGMKCAVFTRGAMYIFPCLLRGHVCRFNAHACASKLIDILCNLDLCTCKRFVQM